ncbi:MAG: hypothetical protein C0631_15890 [Sedimenticola sp.]|nr:MAG: hypothetical protein C0631_15890 [Sedimenticola sp.]
MLPKEWDIVCADLDALNKTLNATETVENQHYQIWRRESIKTLPPATFVWLDDLEAAWKTAFSKERMHIMDERPGDRQLNLTPMIPSNVANLVYEGFEPFLTNTKSSSNSDQTAIVRFEELHHYLMLDPFYGVESAATESVINGIYRENADNQLFQQFSHRFSLAPCKTDKQRHLIYLWCGLMGLHAYRGEQPLNWDREDYLEHWTDDFDLELNEIKTFLRKHNWPLPTWFFPDDVDNTERKMALDDKEFETAFHDFAVTLPQLEKELAEIEAIQPHSMKERREKFIEKNQIEQQIIAIKTGHNPQPTDQPTATETQNSFIFTGDHWDITYEGNSRTFKNTLGMRYIAWLIENQGKEVFVTDLYYAINPLEAGTTDPVHSKMSSKELEALNLSVGIFDNPEEILTPEEKARFNAEITKIKDRIEDAEELGDIETKEKYESQLEEISHYIATQTGLGGKSRKTPNSIEKIRISVTKRIKGDLKKIINFIPDLGHHLDKAIQTGTALQYTPHPHVSWYLLRNK